MPGEPDQKVSVREFSTLRRAKDEIWPTIILLSWQNLSVLPDELRPCVHSVELSDPRILLAGEGTERSASSVNLSRYQASVLWLNHVTSFETTHDPQSFVVLAFVLADDISTWAKPISLWYATTRS